jgi:hypothetical protein
MVDTENGSSSSSGRCRRCQWLVIFLWWQFFPPYSPYYLIAERISTAMFPPFHGAFPPSSLPPPRHLHHPSINYYLEEYEFININPTFQWNWMS